MQHTRASVIRMEREALKEYARRFIIQKEVAKREKEAAATKKFGEEKKEGEKTR